MLACQPTPDDGHAIGATRLDASEAVPAKKEKTAHKPVEGKETGRKMNLMRIINELRLCNKEKSSTNRPALLSKRDRHDGQRRDKTLSTVPDTNYARSQLICTHTKCLRIAVTVDDRQKQEITLEL